MSKVGMHGLAGIAATIIGALGFGSIPTAANVGLIVGGLFLTGVDHVVQNGLRMLSGIKSPSPLEKMMMQAASHIGSNLSEVAQPPKAQGA